MDMHSATKEWATNQTHMAVTIILYPKGSLVKDKNLPFSFYRNAMGNSSLKVLVGKGRKKAFKTDLE